MHKRTEYVTWVNGTAVYRGAELESAVRAWDGNPDNFRGDRPSGGVSVQTWHDDVMVRDGWILHVYDNGQVYLNPNLSDLH